MCRSMGKNCVVAGCSKTHKKGASLFKFPTEKTLRMKWIKQVQRTRVDWKEPSAYSCVCSDHFTEDCFQERSTLSDQFGLKVKRMLKPDAVPTIFPRPSDPLKLKRQSSVYEKRERARVSIFTIYIYIIIMYNYIYI